METHLPRLVPSAHSDLHFRLPRSGAQPNYHEFAIRIQNNFLALAKTCSISERIASQHASKIYSMQTRSNRLQQILSGTFTLPVMSSSNARFSSSHLAAAHFPSRIFTSCAKNLIVDLVRSCFKGNPTNIS